MLAKIKLYETGDLEKVVAKGAESFGSESAWSEQIVAAFARIVSRRPLFYRSFGPFWWPLKTMMVEAGFLVATPPDGDLVAQVTTGHPTLDVAAAWALHESNANQFLNDGIFVVDTEDGDTFDYLLYDEEMELMVVIKG